VVGRKRNTTKGKKMRERRGLRKDMKLPGDHGDVKMTLTVVKVLPWLEV